MNLVDQMNAIEFKFYLQISVCINSLTYGMLGEYELKWELIMWIMGPIT